MAPLAREPLHTFIPFAGGAIDFHTIPALHPKRVVSLAITGVVGV